MRTSHVIKISSLAILSFVVLLNVYVALMRHLAARDNPNIILIVLDTLRADHLGCYGYDRDTSPNIDNLAEESTVYLNSIASSPWTGPSHASIFTGQYPSVHGLHSFYPAREDLDNVYPMPDDRTTIAEILKDNFYQTGAIVSNLTYLSPKFNLTQGFDHYDHRPGNNGRVPFRDATEINEEVFEWIDNATSPFFLFVNYMDCHAPYDPPEPYDTKYPGKGPFNSQELMGELSEPVLSKARDLTEAEYAHLISQYDGELSYLDHHLGRLFQKLKTDDRYNNTMIIVTSDHGEYFGEHYLLEHSKDIYESVLSVPLIIKYPHSTRKETHTSHFQSIELFDLIFEEIDVALPDVISNGLSAGDSVILVENYFTRRKDLFGTSYSERFNRVRRAMYLPPYKLIWSSDDDHEFYNLGDDSGEEHNIIDQDKEKAAVLFGRMDEWMEKNVRHQDGKRKKLKTNSQDIKNLKSLGYL